jgi:DNA-directed RNA polymerase specialized sigma24 family protein
MSRNYTPDESLIDQILADDTEAFEELHRRYCFSLYRYCKEKLNSHEDAKRITRDIFIQLWENRHRLPVGFSVSFHLYTEVRKAVVRCVNEKLLDKEDLPVIEKQIIPGFSVDRLQKARMPVTYTQNEHAAHTQSDTKSEIPWWNRYPVPEVKKFKYAFRTVMNLF